MKIWKPAGKKHSQKSDLSRRDSSTIGCEARSVAGRDAGSTYIIINVTDDGLAEAADGKYRTVQRPKIKNLRHLLLTGRQVPPQYIVYGGVSMTNDEIYEFLAEDAAAGSEDASYIP